MTSNHIPADEPRYRGLIRFHDPKTDKHCACLGDPNLYAEKVKNMIGGKG